MRHFKIADFALLASAFAIVTCGSAVPAYAMDLDRTHNISTELSAEDDDGREGFPGDRIGGGTR